MHLLPKNRDPEGTRTLNLRIDSPEAETPNFPQINNLEPLEKAVYTNLQQVNSEISKELAKLVDVWPSLPRHVRQTILNLVNILK